MGGARQTMTSSVTRMLRFIVSLVVLSLASFGVPSSASADGWPNRAVKIITPQPPGTGIDLAARLFADRLSARWGQAVIVENRPGADGVAGVSTFVNARDDHTLLFSFGSPITISPLISENKLPYDPDTDLVPIGSVVDIILGFAAASSTNVTSLAELDEFARRNPGKYNWGATAGLPQFVFAGYAEAMKLPLVEIPYKDLTPALVDLASGRVQFFATSYASLRATLEGKQARLVAILNRERAPMAPDVPTMSELGHPEFAVDSFAGFFGGRGLAPETRQRVASDIQAIGGEAEIAARLASFGMVLKVTTPGDFAEMIRKQKETVASVLRSISH